MKLIENLIGKMLELYEEFEYRGYEVRSVWHFYNCYNLAIAILGIEDEDLRLKNLLWKRIMDSLSEGELDFRRFNKLRKFIPEDMAVVTKALIELSKENESLGYNEGDHWTKDALAVPYYEIDI